MARNAAALVAGAVMAGSLLGAAPAFASPASPAACPVNRFCAWTGLNYTGLFGQFTASAVVLGGAADNNIESVSNGTGSRWCLYDDHGFRDFLLAVAPGEERNLPVFAQNKVSSMSTC